MPQTPAWFTYPTFNWKHKHAVVIGAGIAGCQIAWHLAQQGWQITLIERHGKIAQEASGNPAGVISPKMTAQASAGEHFYTQSFHYTLQLLKQLQEENGLQWQQSGMLQLAHNSREEKRWQALQNRDFDPDFLQSLNKKQASEIAGISLDYKACYFPQAGWVNPTHFCKVLSQHKNIETVLNTQALRLEKYVNQLHVIDESKNTISTTEVVVVASGKDLGQFEQTTFLPSMPVAGQTTLATASDYSQQLKTIIGHEGYLTPADTKTNQHTFGATFERNNNTPEIDTIADQKNFNQLTQYLAEFENSLSNTTSAHTAVRLTTPDRFPYAGALPELEFYKDKYNDLHHGKKWKKYPQAKYQQGLFVLGGFGSRGLTTSGYCAKLLTGVIENQSLSSIQNTILNNSHPARYLIRQLKKSSKTTL